MESPSSCQCCGNEKYTTTANNTAGGVRDDFCFDINLTHQGKSNIITVSTTTNGLDLHKKTLQALFAGNTNNDDDQVDVDLDGNDNANANGNADMSMTELKLLFKGKRITAESDVFPFASIDKDIHHAMQKKKKNRKPLKIMVVATNNSTIQELKNKKSDPLIRGFDQQKDVMEKRKAASASLKKYYWGEGMVQDRNYKFVRIKACTNHSFGHRSTDKTPHHFQAMELLEKMATDPGIVALMKERELVVNTLGEMDTIDDRIMQRTEQSGGCLLGYNTNRGLRIDIKLRTDDLQGFRPYPDLISTLIHELSHNWVGEHNLIFWTNYAQMRVEYFDAHAQLQHLIVRGKTTSELAGLDRTKLEHPFDSIMVELVKDMAQHGLHPNMIANAIQQRIHELEKNRKLSSSGIFRSGGEVMSSIEPSSIVTPGTTARELALAAAERRAREQQKKNKDDR
mmetsp:Transcript_11184/g.12398  ORF Transcript_11184/g.12398 Transcript_11184/m.12398 type:complete len:454 (-) Transcript_11184:101-1462(-)